MQRSRTTDFAYSQLHNSWHVFITNKKEGIIEMIDAVGDILSSTYGTNHIHQSCIKTSLMLVIHKDKWTNLHLIHDKTSKNGFEWNQWFSFSRVDIRSCPFSAYLCYMHKHDRYEMPYLMQCCDSKTIKRKHTAGYPKNVRKIWVNKEQFKILRKV